MNNSRTDDKRNLMSELKEGIDFLAEKRHVDNMNKDLEEHPVMHGLVTGLQALKPTEPKKRVYLVFRETIESYQFQAVFFTEEAAQSYVAKQKAYKKYDIEVFEETDNGMSREVY